MLLQFPVSMVKSNKVHIVLLMLAAMLFICSSVPAVSYAAGFLGFNFRGTASISTNNTETNRTTTIVTPSLTTVLAESVETESETAVYTFSVSKQLTKVLSLNASASYYERTVNGVKGTSSTNPVVSISFRPPAIYTLSLNYGVTQTFPSETFGLTSENLGVRFSIPLDERFPSFNILYGQSSTKDDQSPSVIDSTSESYALSSSYTLKAFGEYFPMSLNHRINSSSDNISDRETSSTSTGFGFSWSRGFLENKLSVSTSYSLNFNESEFESSVGTRFESALTAVDGLAEITGTPTTSLTATGVTTLIDNDRLATATTLPANDLTGAIGWNFGLDMGALPVDMFRLDLYLRVPVASDFDATKDAVMTSLGWQVHSSNDNATWSPVLLGGVTIKYFGAASPTESVYVATFILADTNARYIKLYNSGTTGKIYPVTVTELEAFEALVATDTKSASTERDSNSVSLALGYNHSKELSFRFSISMSESGSDQSKGTSSLGMSGGASYTPRRDLRMSFSNSYSKSESKDTKSEADNSSNSFTVNYNPLPGFAAHLSTSFSESSINSQVSSESVVTTFGGNAKIIKGVDVSFTTTVRESEAPESGASSSGSSNRWTLRLNPWKGTSINYSAYDSSAESESPDGVKTSSSSSGSSANLSMRLTSKMMFSYSTVLTPDTMDNYGLSLNVSPGFFISASHFVRDNLESTSIGVQWRLFKKVTLSLSHSMSNIESITSYDANPPVEPEPRVVTSEQENTSTSLRATINF